MADTNSLSALSVADLLERFPQAALVLVSYRMACVGCDIAAFHTVAEAAAIYRVDQERFVQELELKVRSGNEGRALNPPEELK